MKTTMRAILVNLSNEQKALLNNLMLVFCTAIRYSFKRLKLFKKRKEVNTPGLWLVRRKELLGIA